jgi:hypothetical protein
VHGLEPIEIHRNGDKINGGMFMELKEVGIDYSLFLHNFSMNLDLSLINFLSFIIILITLE